MTVSDPMPTEGEATRRDPCDAAPKRKMVRYDDTTLARARNRTPFDLAAFQNLLQTHELLRSESVVPFVCGVCFKSYPSDQTCSKHLNRQHSDLLPPLQAVLDLSGSEKPTAKTFKQFGFILSRVCAKTGQHSVVEEGKISSRRSSVSKATEKSSVSNAAERTHFAARQLWQNLYTMCKESSIECLEDLMTSVASDFINTDPIILARIADSGSNCAGTRFAAFMASEIASYCENPSQADLQPLLEKAHGLINQKSPGEKRRRIGTAPNCQTIDGNGAEFADPHRASTPQTNGAQATDDANQNPVMVLDRRGPAPSSPTTPAAAAGPTAPASAPECKIS